MLQKMKAWNLNKLGNKLIAVFVLFFLVPFLLIFLYLSNDYQNNLQRNISTAVQDNFTQIGYGINSVMEDMVNASYALLKDSAIRNALETSDNSEAGAVLRLRTIEDVFKRINNSILLKYYSPYIFVVDSEGLVYSVPSLLEVQLDGEKLGSLLAPNGEAFVWVTENQKVFRYESDKEPRITIARKLRQNGT